MSRLVITWATVGLLTSTALAGGTRREPDAFTPQPMPAGLAQLRGPPSLSITVAGGVSLGAYEAGVLHYMAEILRMNPMLGRPRVITGASAGSTNGFMTILATCSTETEPVPPRKSLFYNTWIPLGMSRLWSPERNGGTQGAFSRDWMEHTAAELERAFDEGLREDCDVVLGISVTRVVPRQLPTTTDAFSLPRVEERFALRVQGRGAGKRPRLTNYVSTTSHAPQLLLPEDPDGEVPFDGLRDLVFASSAFPLAFPPQPLRHCIAYARDGQAPRCPASAAVTDLFVDGGLFDNTPLRLAARLAANGLVPDEAGTLGWRDDPTDVNGEPPPGVLFAYVSPDAAAYPSSDESTAISRDTPALALVLQVAGAFVATARAKNLATLLEDQPSMVDRTMIPVRHYPAASAPMGAFLGFFDQSLREFDFALGTYDARRMVTRGIQPVLRRHNPDFRLRVPDDASGDPSWGTLECMRAALGDRSGARETCEPRNLERFRILLQASIFRLWDECSRETVDAVRVGAHRHCHTAREGQPPVLVPGVRGSWSVAWRRLPGETETVYVFRLLSELGFAWKDLGLGPRDSDEALTRIRHVVGDVAADLTERQPAEDRFVLRKVSGLAANSLTYVPPRWAWWVMVGRQFELGGSYRPSDGPWAMGRLHAALQVHGLGSVLSSDHNHVAPALVAGIDLRPPQLASITLQPSLLLRVGYVMAGRDRLGARTCDVNGYDTAACSRPYAQAGVGLSALDVMRIQIMGEVYPKTRDLRTLWAVAPSLGVQLAF